MFLHQGALSALENLKDNASTMLGASDLHETLQGKCCSVVASGVWARFFELFVACDLGTDSECDCALN